MPTSVGSLPSTRGCMSSTARSWFRCRDPRKLAGLGRAALPLGERPLPPEHGARSVTACWETPRSSSAAGHFPFEPAAESPAVTLVPSAPRPAPATCCKSDLWGSDVLVTTSRGHGKPPVRWRSTCSACFLHFAAGDCNHAYRDERRGEFDHRTYRPRLPAGQDRVRHRGPGG